MRQKAFDGLLHNCSRDNQPDSSRLLQFVRKVLKRRGSNRLFLNQLIYCFWRHVEDHALVAALDETTHHICSHPAKTNHSKLHNCSFSILIVSSRLSLPCPCDS